VQRHSQTGYSWLYCTFFKSEVQDFNKFVIIIIIYYCKLAYTTPSEVALS